MSLPTSRTADAATSNIVDMVDNAASGMGSIHTWLLLSPAPPAVNKPNYLLLTPLHLLQSCYLDRLAMYGIQEPCSSRAACMRLLQICFQMVRDRALRRSVKQHSPPTSKNHLRFLHTPPIAGQTRPSCPRAPTTYRQRHTIASPLTPTTCIQKRRIVRTDPALERRDCVRPRQRAFRRPAHPRLTSVW